MGNMLYATNYNEIKKRRVLNSLIKGSNNHDFEEYYNNFYNEQLVSYDMSYTIGGYSPKRFVRYNSDKLKDLFDSIISQDSSYITYINDLINGYYVNNSRTFPIKSISVLRKIVDCPQGAINEELGSKIANIFKLPTVYNFVVNKTAKEPNYLREIVSVDFLKKGESLVTLNDMGMKCFPDRLKNELEIFQLEDCVKKLKKTLSSKLKTCPNKDEVFYNIIRDFIKSYFIKYLIMSDGDFAPRNFAIITNIEENYSKAAPIYDYECCFSRRNNSFLPQFNVIDNAINYVLKYYPEILKEIEEILDCVLQSGKLDALMYDYSSITSCNTNGIKVVKDRATFINKKIKFRELTQSQRC